jgi:hypothetical protein
MGEQTYGSTNSQRLCWLETISFRFRPFYPTGRASDTLCKKHVDPRPGPGIFKEEINFLLGNEPRFLGRRACSLVINTDEAVILHWMTVTNYSEKCAKKRFLPFGGGGDCTGICLERQKDYEDSHDSLCLGQKLNRPLEQQSENLLRKYISSLGVLVQAWNQTAWKAEDEVTQDCKYRHIAT